MSRMWTANLLSIEEIQPQVDEFSGPKNVKLIVYLWQRKFENVFAP